MKRLLILTTILLVSQFARGQCTPLTGYWTEDFESWTITSPINSDTNHCWTNTSYQNPYIQWRLDRFGQTPTTYTGPNGALSGDQYVYFESSGGRIQPTAADLVSPLISMDSLVSPGVEFYYHMYGSDMGTLKVEVSADSGYSWQNLWSISGEQDTTYTDPWNYKRVSLSRYVGDTIQIKFIGVDKSSDMTGDIALDDISMINCPTTYDTINAVVCGFYTSPTGKQIHQPGIHYDTLINSTGCDSLIVMNLTSGNAYDTIVVAGNNFTLPNGVIIAATGFYQDTISTTSGCDSVRVIDFTSLVTIDSVAITACNSFVSASGTKHTLTGVFIDTLANVAGFDSIIVIDITILNGDTLSVVDSTCGEPYVSDFGISYPNTGTFVEYYKNSVGCDSLVIIDVFIQKFDSTISILSNGSYPTLKANEPNQSYQWIDCSNGGSIILGEIKQTYLTISNGHFACIVTDSVTGCLDTTNCINVTLGIQELENLAKIFPNPTTGIVNISLNSFDANNTTVELYSAQGKLAYKTSLDAQVSEIDISHLAKGVYTIKIANSDIVTEQLLILE